MISNITNALPALLKKIRENNTSIGFQYDIAQSIRFYESIVSKRNHLAGLKHMYLDITYSAGDGFQKTVSQLNATLDTLQFIKCFKFITDPDSGKVTVRGSIQQFAVFSLIILGAVDQFGKQFNNSGFFTVLAQDFMSYCIQNGYNVCRKEQLQSLSEYNFNARVGMFSRVSVAPTSQQDRATFNFVGIRLDQDVLCILERYQGVDFTYNEQNGSFLITMDSTDWDDFWKNAPQSLKNQFQQD